MIYCILGSLFYILNRFSKQNKNTLLFFSGLTLFLAVRFGVGVDYFSYGIIYYTLPSNFNLASFFINGVELGFSLIMILLKKLHLSYDFFIFFYSVVSMVFLWKIFSYSQNKFFSLTIFLLNYFLPYSMTAIRQFFAMILFILVLIEYLRYKNIIKYFIAIFFVAICFHISVLAYMILPFLLNINFLSFKRLKNPAYFLILCVFSFFCSFIFIRMLISAISLVLPKFAFYFGKKLTVSYNFFSVAVRLIFALLVIFILNKNKYKLSKINEKICQVYLIGVLFYMFLGGIQLLSRLTDYLTFIEILVFPNIIVEKKIKDSLIVRQGILFIFLILYLKDINSSISLGRYNNNHFFDYPYITIFNKNDFEPYASNEKDDFRTYKSLYQQ